MRGGGEAAGEAATELWTMKDVKDVSMAARLEQI